MAQRRVLLDRLISSCRCRISTVRGLVSAEAVVRDVVRRSFRWRVPQPWYLISLILRRCDVAGRVQWCQSAGYRMTDELATELANALRELVAREADRMFNLALQIVRQEAASDGPPLLPTVAERQTRKEAPAERRRSCMPS
jgi:hypothetical protein